MQAVYRRELRAYLCTMSGYTFIAVFLLSAGLFFTVNNIFMASDSFSNVLLSTCYIMILIVPALTMRTFAEERKTMADQLMLTSPVKLSGIVFGKYLAALTILAIVLLLSLIYPIILMLLGRPYIGEIALGYIGCFLVGACLIALGMFLSSVTENQLSSAVSSTAALLFLFLADNIGPSIPISGVSDIVCGISPFYYLRMFRVGLLMPTSVAFLLSFIAVFVFLTMLSIDRRMWRKHGRT